MYKTISAFVYPSVGSLVCILSGPYKADLARVVGIEESREHNGHNEKGKQFMVEVIPQLRFKTLESKERRRDAICPSSLTKHPLARLFRVEDVHAVGENINIKESRPHSPFYTFCKHHFQNNLELIHYWEVTVPQRLNTTPKIQEEEYLWWIQHTQAGIK